MSTATIAQPIVREKAMMTEYDVEPEIKLDRESVARVIREFLRLGTFERQEVARGVCLTMLPFANEEPLLIFDQNGELAGVLKRVDPLTLSQVEKMAQQASNNGLMEKTVPLVPHRA